jgi:hypothetical protein
MCHRAKPTIWDPRDHVQTVFSQRMRAANKMAKGEAQTHQILRKLGKAPGNCMVLHSNAQRRQLLKSGVSTSLRRLFAHFARNQFGWGQ